jgi:hypothetical protein
LSSIWPIQRIRGRLGAGGCPACGAQGGEEPIWTPGKRFALHHSIVSGATAYGAWRDGGLTLLDVSDPAKPELIAHRNWCPPFGGGSHTALPLPGRQLVIVADESIADHCEDQVKYVWVVDVREPANPVTISTFPTPAEDDYCAKGGHFGPHNLHENRPGSFQSSELIFATYQNVGVRVVDIRNQFQPRQVAFYAPPAPEKMFAIRVRRASGRFRPATFMWIATGCSTSPTTTLVSTSSNTPASSRGAGR